MPDREEVAASLARVIPALESALARRVVRARERLGFLRRALGDPERRFADLAVRVDDLAGRGRQALLRQMAWDGREVASLAARLERSGPAPAVRRAGERLEAAAGRLRFALAVRVRHARAGLEGAAARLDALSPLACLARGYAIVRRGAPTGPIVNDAAALAPGDAVVVLFARGRAQARIDATEE